ncbi:MAG TPA: TIM barrel protein [Bryobacteraceae bacterium]|nr:TIM barrel protein [Bryobacteraceae bacterium]
MSIRVASAPVSWGVMEAEGFDGRQTYGEVLDEIAQAGYEGTELGPYGFLPTEPTRLQSELKRRRLTLVGAFVPLPLAAAERHEAGFREAMKTADLLAKSGARFVVLADEMSPERMAVAGRVTERDGLTEAQWKRAATLVTRAAEACAQRGLCAVFHHHVGTFVETPEEVERLFALTDPGLLGLCLDTGHYHYGGGDAVKAAKRYGKRIRHLHFKDVRPAALETARRERLDFLGAVRHGVFCELGEGAVDLPKVVEALNESGFDGWAVVEQDVDIAQPDVRPLESARRSRQYLREKIRI